MNGVGKFLYSIHSGMDVLPQRQPYTSAQIQRAIIKAQGAEHFPHRRKREGVTTTFNLAYLRSLYTYARTQFLLREVLLDACLLDGLAKMIGFQFFFQLCLHRVPFRSTYRTPYFVHDIAERGQFKFFHTLLFVVEICHSYTLRLFNLFLWRFLSLLYSKNDSSPNDLGLGLILYCLTCKTLRPWLGITRF